MWRGAKIIQSALSSSYNSRGASSSVAKASHGIKELCRLRFYSTESLGRLPGRATHEATAEYNKSHPTAFNPHIVPKTGLSVSRLGFGGYRVGTEERDHQYALNMALQAGCNFIDTSPSYMDGASEYMIGTVLKGMTEDKIIKREEVIVCSKVGYLQGQNLERYRYSGKLDRDRDRDEFVEVDSDHVHCISSPDFLSSSISDSLARLGLQQLDVMYLHNPEYVWSASVQRGEPREAAEEHFYERLKRGFAHLEEEVERGRIAAYGISSNVFVKPPKSTYGAGLKEEEDTTEGEKEEDASASVSLSLEKCIQIAHEVRPDNHFAYVQFPLNLQETYAYTDRSFASPSRGRRMNILEYAEANKLYRVSNRPLNALHRGDLYRFIDYPSYADTDISNHLRNAFERCVVLETNIPWLEGSDRPQGDKRLPTKASVSWGQILRQNLHQIDNLYKWREVLKMRVEPELQHALTLLRQHPNSSQYNQWVLHYKYACTTLFQLLTKFWEQKAHREIYRVSEALERLSPSLERGTMAQKALRVLCSTGVDTVLVGMRDPKYVREFLVEMPHQEQGEQGGGEIPREEVDAIMHAKETKIEKIELMEVDEEEFARIKQQEEHQ